MHSIILIELTDCDLWAWRLEDARGGLTAKGYQPTMEIAWDMAAEYAHEGGLKTGNVSKMLGQSGRDW